MKYIIALFAIFFLTVNAYCVFPASPALNDEWVELGQRYIYTANGWQQIPMTYIEQLNTKVEVTDAGFGILDMTFDGTKMMSCATDSATHTVLQCIPTANNIFQLGDGTNRLFNLYSTTGTITTFNTSTVAGSSASNVQGTSTSDGSDTRMWAYCGGGTDTPTRGACLDIYGNEHATYPGQIRLQSGEAGYLSANASLVNDTGNQIAYNLTYTTNKGTSGNDSGLVINQTDTASPGVSLLFDAQVSAVSKAKIDNVGNTTLAGYATVVKVTGDPCGTYPEGAIFYNDTSDYYCFCNAGGADVQMHSPGTACF